ncbi:MAG: Ig-like domain-containing protein [Cyclobacteriaceae bacterium]
MKTFYSNDYAHRRLKRRLLVFELVVFFFCMLYASISEAQDVTAPSILSLSPVDDATDVSVTQWVYEVTFDEDIQIGTDPILLKIYDTDATYAGANLSQMVTINGSVATIDFNALGGLDGFRLTGTTQYYIHIPDDSFQDLSGNGYAGHTKGNWNFTTEVSDNIDPVVLSFSPADDAREIALDNWVFEVTFDEDIQLDLTATKGVVLRDAGDFTITSMLPNSPGMTVSNGTLTMDFNHDGALDVTPLNENAVYHIEISADIIEDLTGNGFNGFIDNETWNFFTIDTQSPGINQLSPSNGATGVLVNESFSIIFDEPTIKLTGTFDLYEGTTLIESNDINGADVTFNSSSSISSMSTTFSSLQPETTYNVRLTAGVVEDLAGNDFAGILNETTWTFTTMDDESVPPVLDYVYPDDDDTDVSIGDIEEDGLSFGFDEDVIAGTGNIEIRQVSDGTLVQSISIDSEDIEFESSDVYVYGLTGIPYNTELYITICGTCVTDILGNPYAGNNVGDWSFTTEVGPFELVSLSPSNGATDGSSNSQVTLTFTHDADIGAGNIQVFDASDDGLVAQLNNFNGTYMTIDGPSITFDFIQDFPMGDELYINVSDGYLRSDLTPDDWAGIQDNTSWRFTVEDTRPQIVSFTPTTEVASAGVVFELTYDRDIALNSISSVPALRIYKSDASQVAFFNKNNPNISIDGATATFTLTYALDPEENYYVTLGEGLFVDALDTGNPGEDIDDDTTWTFSTRANDGNGPDLVSLSPANGEGQVLTSGNDIEFAMTFDEPVFLGNTNDKISLWKDDESGDELFYDIGDPSVISISEDNLTVTLDIPNHYNLAQETTYYILIDNMSGSDPIIYDADGNGIAAVSDENDWRFTTYGPIQITDFDPDNGATDVPVDQLFGLLTNNALNASGSGTIRLRNYETGSIQRTIIMPSSDVGFEGIETNISFDGTGGDLEEGQHYYIDIASGVFRDDFNQTFTTSHKDTWNFTTADETAPTVTTLFPTDDNDNVALSTSLIIDFNENIELGTGSITLYNEDDEVVETYSSTENFDRLTIGLNDITIDPTNDLEDGTGYYILIGNDAVKDDDGFDNFFMGITDKSVWNFSTPDNTAPSLVSTSPDDGETGISVDSDISLTFDEEIMGNVSGSNQIRILETSGPLVEAFTDMSRVLISGNTITIDPTNDFAFDTEYIVYFWYGAVLDGNNNSAAATEWTFTTEIGPVEITGLNPADNSVDVAIDQQLSITFNQDIQLGINGTTKQVAIRRSGASLFELIPLTADNISGNVLFIDHLNFEYDQEYYINIDAGVLADLSNSSFPGITDNTTWTFTTEEQPDVTAPSVVSLSPEDDETETGITEDLIIVFDEPVVKGPGGKAIQLRRADNGTIYQNIPVGNSIVQISGATVTIDIVNLPEKTDFYINIEDGTFQDSAGNEFGGISNDTDWNFTTHDATPPILIALSPADNSTGIQLDPTLVMTFNEEVASTGAGQYRMFNKSTGEQIGPNWYFPAGAVFEENEVSYTIPIDLPYETEIYINVLDAIEDPAGNRVDITGTEAWTFTTIENDDPTDLSMTLQSVDENEPVNTYIGAFSVTDPNESDTHVISFASGEGDDDNDSFQLNVFQLRTNEVFDFETKNSYSIRLRVTDNYNNFFEKQFTITINDVEEDPGNNNPTDITLSGNSIHENAAIGTLIGSLSSSDDDESDTHAYSFVSGEGDSDNTSFTLDGNELKNAEVFDFESKSAYSVRIKSTDNNGGSFEKSFTITINDVVEAVDQTITFESISDKTFGDVSFTIHAASSSGLDIQFSVESGPIQITENTVTITGAGEAVIAANQSGDDTYNPAIEVTKSFTINKAGQVITIDPIADKQITDNPFEVSASVNTGLSLTYEVSGPATISGSSISLTGTTGNVTVTVRQAGNENYLEASAVTTFSVLDPGKTNQTITFEAIADKTFGDSPFEVMATASSGLDVVLSVISGPVTVDGNEVSITGTGTAIIAANQSGDETYNAAGEVTRSFEINKADQTLTFEEITDKAFGDASFELSASASSGLDVQFTVVNGPVSISGTTATINGAGEVTIAANQEGNENYHSADQMSQTFTVAKADQVITLESIPDKLITDNSFDISATVDTELELVYEISGPATVSGNTVTLDGVEGTVTVTVSQEGNENYHSATASTSFEVTDEEALAIGDPAEVKVYPNPFTSFIKIESTTEVSVRLFDLQGKLISKDLFSNGKLDLRSLDQGVYLLELVGKEVNFQKRIVKTN